MYIGEGLERGECNTLVMLVPDLTDTLYRCSPYGFKGRTPFPNSSLPPVCSYWLCFGVAFEQYVYTRVIAKHHSYAPRT